MGAYRNIAEQRLGRLKAELAYADVRSIAQSGLHQFVDGLQSTLNEVGAGIHDTFFAMRPIDAARV